MGYDHKIQGVGGLGMTNSLLSSSSSRISSRIENIASNSSSMCSRQHSKIYLSNLIRIIVATLQCDKTFQSIKINQRAVNSNKILERKITIRMIKVEIQSQAKYKSRPLSSSSSSLSISLIKFKDFNSNNIRNQFLNKSLQE